MKPDQFALGLVASLNIHSTYQSRLKYSSDGRVLELTIVIFIKESNCQFCFVLLSTRSRLVRKHNYKEHLINYKEHLINYKEHLINYK